MPEHGRHGKPSMLEEFAFRTCPYSNASVDRATGQGRRIRLASKIPFYLLQFYLFVIRETMVQKQGNLMGEEKIHSLYLQRKDTSSHGPSAYRTVPYMKTEMCFRFLDGNGNVFPFP